jgi:uncharacterized surface protein with fasciclin (FAS1) repeats
MRPAIVVMVLCAPLMATAALAAGAEKNLLEAATAEGNLTTFVDLVKSSPSVKSALTGPGPLTVFAPTDEAFAKLAAGRLDALKGSEDKRESALLSHCAGGALLSTQLVQAKSVSSLWSKEFPVTGAGKALKIGAANVVRAEIKASNGVLYVIDSVLPSE